MLTAHEAPTLASPKLATLHLAASTAAPVPHERTGPSARANLEVLVKAASYHQPRRIRIASHHESPLASRFEARIMNKGSEIAQKPRTGLVRVRASYEVSSSQRGRYRRV